MKKALISPTESVADGVRIAEVTDYAFPVSPPLYWIDVPDGVDASTHHLTMDGAVVLTPEPPTEPQLSWGGQSIPVTNMAPTSITPLEFIDRFTEAEQLAIVTATMTNPVVKLWYDKLLAAQSVVFADPRLSAGLDGLVDAGLITAERKAEILPESGTAGVAVL